MSTTQLKASRLLWLARERYRLKRWRYHHERKHKLAGKWWRLWEQAHEMRMRREHQLEHPHTISGKGVELITRFEGFVGHPYKDAVGVWTIGYGHTAGVGPTTPSITEAQAKALLRSDLERTYVPPVRAFADKLNQNQFDALVSAVYNLGPAVLDQGHTLGNALRAGNVKLAGDALLLYDHAGGQKLPGLTTRRRAERDLFFA